MKGRLVAGRMCFVCDHLITPDKEPHSHDKVTDLQPSDPDTNNKQAKAQPPAPHKEG